MIGQSVRMRAPKVVVLATTIVVLGVGGFAFAATRHTSACRGSYTYGADGGKCGSPIAPTTASHVAAAAQEPFLGRSWSVSQQGYGKPRPSSIDNGGDPTGIVENLRWQSWGQDRAIASGFSYYEAPGKIVAESTREPVTVVAFNLGTCTGIRAYTAIEWYFPQHGERFDPATYIDICTGEHLGNG